MSRAKQRRSRRHPSKINRHGSAALRVYSARNCVQPPVNADTHGGVSANTPLVHACKPAHTLRGVLHKSGGVGGHYRSLDHSADTCHSADTGGVETLSVGILLPSPLLLGCGLFYEYFYQYPGRPHPNGKYTIIKNKYLDLGVVCADRKIHFF